ncbi:MAG: biotin synthase BioB [Candidatus Omnitrophica bacterium]|nr:biotin synthase BioB [Candidatus Omnitrophota bacterium]MDE2231311.1 biotin synthase BioB [Candidatus Omnitrophota bacterium]
MDRLFYLELARRSMNGEQLDNAACAGILSDTSLEILPLLDAAYQVRKHYFGKEVRVHILNNAQNGHCREDCHYCAQASSSAAQIEEYGIKPDEEILQEARQAYAKGAACYCMVFAGRGASQSRIEHLKRLLAGIKSEFPDKEICVSTGFVSDEGAVELKKAGLDRLNHNLNTSEAHYPNICTTHTFTDRLNTLLAAKAAGLKVCSGMIVGMGENNADIIEVALRLRALKAESIPVNLLVPIEGNVLGAPGSALTPDFILRVLCLFRFLNPASEIRVAAGREIHLRSMEVMALYPANSLFLQGYLNAKGASNARTLQMIKDAGFSIKSEVDLDELLERMPQQDGITDSPKVLLKTLKELRPAI